MFAVLQAWLCAFEPETLFLQSASPACAETASVAALDASLDESVDFYQYTDSEGVIHFMDTLEKIPRRYRDRVIVRKDVPSARQTTKVRIVEKEIHVPVTIRNGDRTVQAVLLLDTGASMTSISEELADRLNIVRSSTRPATTRLADGRKIDIRLTKVDSVVVGARTISPLEVAILSHVGAREVHDGFLGLDFLGEFQYQIDFANELIRWQ